jgi:hypothetical protein
VFRIDDVDRSRWQSMSKDPRKSLLILRETLNGLIEDSRNARKVSVEARRIAAQARATAAKARKVSEALLLEVRAQQKGAAIKGKAARPRSRKRPPKKSPKQG